MCDYCDEQFPSVFTAKLHTELAHGDKKEEFDKKYKIYICLKEDCGKAHYTIKALHSHYRDFHKENPKDISIYCKQEEPLDLTCERLYTNVPMPNYPPGDNYVKNDLSYPYPK